MTGPFTLLIAIAALFSEFLWPRFLYTNLAGKGVNPYTLLTIALLGFSLLSFVLRAKLRRTVTSGLTQSWLLIVLFATFWFWRFLSDILVGSPDSVTLTFIEFLYIGSWMVSASIIFADRRLRDGLPYIVAISGLIATLFGILEAKTGIAASHLPGFSFFSAGDTYSLDSLTTDTQRGGVGRVRSLYTHPIVYGQYLAAMTPFALHLMFAPRLLGKLLGALLTVGIVISLILSTARSPLVVFAIGVAAYMGLYLFDFRRRLRLSLGVFLAGAAVFVLPIGYTVFDQLRTGRTMEEARSSSARDTQMDRGITALSRSPIVGYGFGSAGQYAATYGMKNTVSVDNYFLTTAVETGYAGLVLFLAMLAAIFGQGLRAVYSIRESRPRSIACAATATALSLSFGFVALSITDQLTLIFQMGGFLVAASGANVMARREQRREAAEAQRASLAMERPVEQPAA